jgi:hypothetical protein
VQAREHLENAYRLATRIEKLNSIESSTETQRRKANALLNLSNVKYDMADDADADEDARRCHMLAKCVVS